MGVEIRKERIMNEWYKTEYPRLFPDRVKLAKTSSTPPTFGPLPIAPHTRLLTAPRSLSSEEVAQLLSSPGTLVGKRFLYSPPLQEQEDRGAWEVVSYTVRKAGEGIEHEFQVVCEALGGDSLPMDEKEVRDLLRFPMFDV
ncbi:hypothetical protein BD309DRAFT_988806 [Dichomitus squalens]|nr:hypothetical protein BD309DRAFT_988806 [Dichomitus squalens]